MRASSALQRGLAPAARGLAARGLAGRGLAGVRAAGRRDRRAEQAARPPPMGEEVKYVPPGAGTGLLHESISGGGGASRASGGSRSCSGTVAAGTRARSSMRPWRRPTPGPRARPQGTSLPELSRRS